MATNIRTRCKLKFALPLETALEGLNHLDGASPYSQSCLLDGSDYFVQRLATSQAAIRARKTDCQVIH